MQSPPNEIRGRIIDRSKYTGIILRKLRGMVGIGRPPEVNLQRYGGATELTPWRGPKPLKPRK